MHLESLDVNLILTLLNRKRKMEKEKEKEKQAEATRHEEIKMPLLSYYYFCYKLSLQD